MPDKRTLQRIAKKRTPKREAVDLLDTSARDKLIALLRAEGIDVPDPPKQPKYTPTSDGDLVEDTGAWAREKLLDMLERRFAPISEDELPPPPKPIEPFVETPPSLFYDEPKKCCGYGERDSCCGYGTAWKGRIE